MSHVVNEILDPNKEGMLLAHVNKLAHQIQVTDE